MASTINVTAGNPSRKPASPSPLTETPLEFTVDPDYTFLRQLTDEELPAVWSRFLGAKKQLVILGDDRTNGSFISRCSMHWRKIIRLLLPPPRSPTRNSATMTCSFLVSTRRRARSLFALPQHPQEGFTLDVRRNPLNRTSMLPCWSQAASTDQTMAVARRLSHYGKYSYLEFNNGRNMAKKITAQPNSGLHFVVEELPAGGATSALISFCRNN